MSGSWRRGTEYEPLEQAFERSVLDYAESKRHKDKDSNPSKRVSRHIPTGGHSRKHGQETYRPRYMIYGNIESYDLRSPPSTAPVSSSQSHREQTQQQTQQQYFERDSRRGGGGGGERRRRSPSKESKRKENHASLHGLSLLSTPARNRQPESHTRPNFPTSPNHRAYDPVAERGTDSYTAKFMKFGRRDGTSSHKEPSYGQRTGRTTEAENLLSQLSNRSSPFTSSRLRRTSSSDDEDGKQGYEEFKRGSLEAVENLASPAADGPTDTSLHSVNMSISDFLQRSSINKEEGPQEPAYENGEDYVDDGFSTSSSHIAEEYQEQHSKDDNLEGLLDSIRHKLEHSKKLQTAIAHIQENKRMQKTKTNDQDSVSSWMASVEDQEWQGEDRNSVDGSNSASAAADDDEPATETDHKAQAEDDQGDVSGESLNNSTMAMTACPPPSSSMYAGTTSEDTLTNCTENQALQTIVHDLTEFSVRLQVRSSALRDTIDHLHRSGFYDCEKTEKGLEQLEKDAVLALEDRESDVGLSMASQSNNASSFTADYSSRNNKLRHSFAYSSLHERARSFAERRKDGQAAGRGRKEGNEQLSPEKEGFSQSQKNRASTHNVEAVSPVSHDDSELSTYHTGLYASGLTVTSPTSATNGPFGQSSGMSSATQIPSRSHEYHSPQQEGQWKNAKPESSTTVLTSYEDEHCRPERMQGNQSDLHGDTDHYAEEEISARQGDGKSNNAKLQSSATVLKSDEDERCDSEVIQSDRSALQGDAGTYFEEEAHVSRGEGGSGNAKLQYLEAVIASYEGENRNSAARQGNQSDLPSNTGSFSEEEAHAPRGEGESRNTKIQSLNAVLTSYEDEHCRSEAGQNKQSDLQGYYERYSEEECSNVYSSLRTSESWNAHDQCSSSWTCTGTPGGNEGRDPGTDASSFSVATSALLPLELLAGGVAEIQQQGEGKESTDSTHIHQQFESQIGEMEGSTNDADIYQQFENERREREAPSDRRHIYQQFESEQAAGEESRDSTHIHQQSESQVGEMEGSTNDADIYRQLGNERREREAPSDRRHIYQQFESEQKAGEESRDSTHIHQQSESQLEGREGSTNDADIENERREKEDPSDSGHIYQQFESQHETREDSANNAHITQHFEKFADSFADGKKGKNCVSSAASSSLANASVVAVKDSEKIASDRQENLTTAVTSSKSNVSSHQKSSQSTYDKDPLISFLKGAL